ncbi:MAG: flagellar biosynthetic protein FliO [Burkholderiaceae bacterium]
MSDTFSPLWAILMLVLVVASVPLSVWVIKRLPGWRPSATGTMSIEETLSLGPRERLVIVQVADRRLLIGATGQAINCLTELPAGQSSHSSDPDGQSNGFAEQLQQARNGR